MTITSKTTIDHVRTADIQTHARRIRSTASKMGRFSLHLLEMTLAMMVVMVLLYLLDTLTPESSRYSVFFEYGTNQFDLAMGVLMTVPMVAWMAVRGHGRRHSVEMAGAMFVPVVAIIMLRLFGAGAYLSWLDYASHPAMFLTMLVAMLYRRDHYTGKAGHAVHASHK